MNRPTSDRQIRYGRILALLFMVAGFAAIGLGWNGMARTAANDEQLPYIVSGGALGIALLMVGVGLLLVTQIRSERQRLNGVLDLMGRALTRGKVQAASPDGQATVSSAGEPFLFQVKNARALALVACIGGFVAIGLGWSGMANRAAPDEQLPYILSGGALGVGLVLTGVAVFIVAQIRTERAKLMTVMQVLATAIARTPAVEDLTAVSPGGPRSAMVVAGPSTYHRESCRLIQGKSGLDRVTLEIAESSGLTPCRVCKPLEGTAGVGAETERKEGDEPELVGAHVEPGEGELASSGSEAEDTSDPATDWGPPGEGGQVEETGDERTAVIERPKDEPGGRPEE